MMALSRFLPFFKPNTQVTPSNENNPVTSNQIIADLPTIEYSKKSLLARKLVALESLQAILLLFVRNVKEELNTVRKEPNADDDEAVYLAMNAAKDEERLETLHEIKLLDKLIRDFLKVDKNGNRISIMLSELKNYPWEKYAEANTPADTSIIQNCTINIVRFIADFINVGPLSMVAGNTSTRLVDVKINVKDSETTVMNMGLNAKITGGSNKVDIENSTLDMTGCKSRLENEGNLTFANQRLEMKNSKVELSGNESKFLNLGELGPPSNLGRTEPQLRPTPGDGSPGPIIPYDGPIDGIVVSPRGVDRPAQTDVFFTGIDSSALLEHWNSWKNSVFWIILTFIVMFYFILALILLSIAFLTSNFSDVFGTLFDAFTFAMLICGIWIGVLPTIYTAMWHYRKRIWTEVLFLIIFLEILAIVGVVITTRYMIFNQYFG